MIDEQEVVVPGPASADAGNEAMVPQPAATAALPPPVGVPAATAPAADVEVPANLALLLDAELEATIRFGDRQMPLREIFELMPGDVIELDQMVDELAQLIVAGRTIAKGEVVVVDGNFGLRITEVASA